MAENNTLAESNETQAEKKPNLFKRITRSSRTRKVAAVTAAGLAAVGTAYAMGKKKANSDSSEASSPENDALATDTYTGSEA